MVTMVKNAATKRDVRRDARAARGELEHMLGDRVNAWPWSSRLSWWVDSLLTLEETK